MDYNVLAALAQSKLTELGAEVTLLRDTVPYTTNAAFVQNNVVAMNFAQATGEPTILEAMVAPAIAPKLLDALIRFGATWFIRKIVTHNIAGTVLYYEVTFTK